MKSDPQVKSELAVNGNGHRETSAERATRQAAAEERQRVVVAAYAGLPDALLRHFELLAQQQRDPQVRCGALELVVAIRRQRERYARRTG